MPSRRRVRSAAGHQLGAANPAAARRPLAEQPTAAGFTAYLRRRGCGGATPRTYVAEATCFEAWYLGAHHGADPATASCDQVAAYIAQLDAAGLAPATIRLAILALRAYFSFRHLFNTPARANPAASLALPAATPPPVAPYRLAEADAILTCAAETAAHCWAAGDLTAAAIARRDHLALTVLCTCGLRRGELCRLNIDDLDLDTASLTVTGKASKLRTITMPAAAAAAAAAYLVEVRPHLHPVGGQLLARHQAEGGGPLTPDDIYAVTYHHGRAAGIGGSHNPHRWRHTCATLLAEAGCDIPAIGAYLGHSRPATTQRYLGGLDPAYLDRLVLAAWA